MEPSAHKASKTPVPCLNYFWLSHPLGTCLVQSVWLPALSRVAHHIHVVSCCLCVAESQVSSSSFSSRPISLSHCTRARTHTHTHTHTHTRTHMHRHTHFACVPLMCNPAQSPGQDTDRTALIGQALQTSRETDVNGRCLTLCYHCITHLP
jgi:hypothetical protein